MERSILPPEQKFYLENRVSRKEDQNSQTEFLNGKVHSNCSFYQFRAFWLGSPLILSSGKKSWNWNECILVKISILSFDHLLQLQTNRFLQVNGKQPSKAIHNGYFRGRRKWLLKRCGFYGEILQGCNMTMVCFCGFLHFYPQKKLSVACKITLKYQNYRQNREANDTWYGSSFVNFSIVNGFCLSVVD